LGRPEGGVFILIVMVIGAFRWMPVARLVRAQFLSLREKEFVEAARALGATTPRLVIRHICPIRSDRSSWPARSTWRRRSSRNRRCRSWASAFRLIFDLGPSVVRCQGLSGHRTALGAVRRAAIFLTVLAINFIGDGLRDALDPRKVM